MLKLAALKFNLWRAMNRRWVVGLRDESSELAINGGGKEAPSLPVMTSKCGEYVCFVFDGLYLLSKRSRSRREGDELYEPSDSLRAHRS
jgi:hypothetical protein